MGGGAISVIMSDLTQTFENERKGFFSGLRGMSDSAKVNLTAAAVVVLVTAAGLAEANGYTNFFDNSSVPTETRDFNRN